MRLLATFVLIEALLCAVASSALDGGEDYAETPERLSEGGGGQKQQMMLQKQRQMRRRRAARDEEAGDGLEDMGGAESASFAEDGGDELGAGRLGGKRRAKRRRPINPDDPEGGIVPIGGGRGAAAAAGGGGGGGGMGGAGGGMGLGGKRRPRPAEFGGGEGGEGAAGAAAPLYLKRLREAERPIELYPSGTLPNYAPTDYSPPHTVEGNAILAAFYSTTLMPRDVKAFLGTARKYFKGDLVVAVHPGMKPDIIELFKKYGAIVYEIPLKCDDKMSLCTFDAPSAAAMAPVPIAMLRYAIYQYWCQLYGQAAKLMIADSRDVVFQSDPFAYNPYEWQGTELALFLETHPNKVIDRCPFNSGWVRNCYGDTAVKQIGYHTVSCSGVTMGTRNGMLIYNMLVASSLDPAVRVRRTPLDASSFSASTGAGASDGVGSSSSSSSSSIVTVKDNAKCVAHGMDQGIHNWLLYSGILGRVFGNRITVFDQGSGPVNTIGGFFGENKIMKLDLYEVGIFKKNARDKVVVYNWNGQPSPAVHQYDRFSAKYLGDSMGQGVLEAMDQLF